MHNPANPQDASNPQNALRVPHCQNETWPQPDASCHSALAGTLALAIDFTTRRPYIAKARELLEYLPLNRQACKDLGMNWLAADARMLQHIAWLRRHAATLPTTSKES